MRAEQKEKFWGYVIGGSLGILLLLPVAPVVAVLAIWNGWVLQRLWEWFIVPSFGWKPLTLLGATGIRILASFLTFTPDTKAEGETKSAAYLCGVAFLAPVLTLGIAWLVRWVLTW